MYVFVILCSLLSGSIGQVPYFYPNPPWIPESNFPSPFFLPSPDNTPKYSSEPLPIPVQLAIPSLPAQTPVLQAPPETKNLHQSVASAGYEDIVPQFTIPNGQPIPVQLAIPSLPAQNPVLKAPPETKNLHQSVASAGYEDIEPQFNIPNAGEDTHPIDNRDEGWLLELPDSEEERNKAGNIAGFQKAKAEGNSNEYKHFVYVEHHIGKPPKKEEKVFIGCYSGSFISNPDANIAIDEDVVRNEFKELVKVNCISLIPDQNPSLPKEVSTILNGPFAKRKKTEWRSYESTATEMPKIDYILPTLAPTPTPTTTSSPAPMVDRNAPKDSTILPMVVRRRQKMLEKKKKKETKMSLLTSLERILSDDSPDLEARSQNGGKKLNMKKAFKLYSKFLRNQ